MKVKLIVKDEVNVQFVGIKKEDLAVIIEETALFVKGAHQSAAYKIGSWNGKESLWNHDGSTFLYEAMKLLDLLEEHYGYEIELIDKRKDIPPEAVPDEITEDFLKDEGVTLRYYQLDATNAVIGNQQGIIEVGTSGGKTTITAAIVKAYQDYYRTIVIVPSEKLAKQTYDELNARGLDTGIVHGKIAAGRRKTMWGKRHVVVTWQTLNRNRDHLHQYDCLIFDECHECGDVMYEVLGRDLAHAHIRVGLTGTVPPDKHKRNKLFAHIGGEVLYSKEAHDMFSEGFISKPFINMHTIVDDDFKNTIDSDTYEWDTEFRYLLNNRDRVEVVADFIRSLPKENTLVLTHSAFGVKLAEVLGNDFIDKDTDTSLREEYYAKFDKFQDYRLVATYRTVGTGISINDIFHVVLVDVGKDYTRIIQSIGRGCRKDSQGRMTVNIEDVYSDLPFSSRHAADRKRIYKKAKYPFKAGKTLRVIR